MTTLSLKIARQIIGILTINKQWYHSRSLKGPVRIKKMNSIISYLKLEDTCIISLEWNIGLTDIDIVICTSKKIEFYTKRENIYTKYKTISLK